MFVADGSKRRTPGGCFLKLMGDEVGPEALKPLYTASSKRKKKAIANRRKLQEGQEGVG